MNLIGGLIPRSNLFVMACLFTLFTATPVATIEPVAAIETAGPFLEIDEAALVTFNAIELMDYATNQLISSLDGWKKLHKSDERAFKNELREWSSTFFNVRRIIAGIMGKTYYLKATQQQRDTFGDVSVDSLLDIFIQAMVLITPKSIQLVDLRQGRTPKTKYIRYKIETETKVFMVEYQLYRKNEEQHWRITNIIADGVNVRKTFNLSFQSLAQRYKGDLNKVISNWSSYSKKNIRSETTDD